jgi:hypothetical protein
MDKDTYYVLAILLSCVSSLASAVNLFLLLRDRAFRPKCISSFVSKVGSSDAFLDSSRAINPATSGQGRAAIVIYNDSTSSCTVQSIIVRPMIKPRMKVFYRLGTGFPLEGQFSPAQFPQTIKGREVAVFSFSPDQISLNRFGELNVHFVGGRSKKLNIEESYYRLSKLSRIISKSRAIYRMSSGDSD